MNSWSAIASTSGWQSIQVDDPSRCSFPSSRSAIPIASAPTLSSREPDPSDQAAAADLWRRVAELDPPLPDLFMDRFLLGWSTTEIAARRQLNPNTVLSHFHRGFKLLREILPEHR